MKIAATENYLCRIIKALGYESNLVGIPESFKVQNNEENEEQIDNQNEIQIIAQNRNSDNKLNKHNKLLSLPLSIENDILFNNLNKTNCDALFVAVKEKNSKEVKESISYIRSIINFEKDIYLFEYNSVKKILDSINEIGELLGRKSQAMQIVKRNEGQLKSLTDGFYERIKNKRVLVLKSIEPLECYGMWVNDLISNVCAKNVITEPNNIGKEIFWDEIRELNPHTIIVAPKNCTLDESLKTFKILEKLPMWDELPAVIRTEVYFCNGFSFQDPLRAITEGSIYLVSCIAGLNPGDITKRDSYRRLRWVELMRHKL